MIYLLSIPGLVLLGFVFKWINKAPVRGVYLAFFATGILETVNLGPLREKVGLTELVILLTWFSMLVGHAEQNERQGFTQLQKLCLFFLSSFLIIEWISFFVNNARFYNYIAGSLVEVLNYTYGAMMVLTVILLVDDWRKLKGCMYAWCLGGVVVSIIGVWAMTGTAPAWTIDEFTGRISSTLKFENQIPAFIIPIFLYSMVMLLSRSITKLIKSGLFILTILMAITMIGTGSRTSFLLLILSVVFLIVIGIVEWRNSDLLKGRLGLFSSACTVGLFAYILAALTAFDGNYSLGHTPSWQRPVVVIYNTLTSEAGTLDRTRLEQADVILENIDQSMFIGNGPKLYGVKYGMSEIHNTYAGIYTESGLFGLIFFVSFLVCSCYTALYVSKREPVAHHKLIATTLVAGFVLLLLYGMTMYGLRQRNIWLLSGLLISTHALLRKSNQS
ncbi:O-antigen ligase family protein [Vibrio sp. 1288]|uniref:O-antigen ligase family protein n=1 Tax=Vibrio sp. 1288 TaxID=3074550 RepID=UPI002965EDEB|nr:O-antigen ligase family protein [Vibrio sp. 1288]MDW3137692.1 O-antigen ligase family protein [Vibrio sp. 1288]